MRSSTALALVLITGATLGLAAPATAAPFFFGTGNPDGKMATASWPSAGSPFEIESADDFDLTQSTAIRSATFTGLIPAGSSVLDVAVEIYRIFPALSDVTRTSGPPTFSTPHMSIFSDSLLILPTGVSAAVARYHD